MRKFQSFFLGVLLLGTMVACMNSVDPGADASSVYQSNLSDISSYATSKGLSGTSTSSGLYYAVTRPAAASAAAAAVGQEVEFNYILYALIRNSTNSAVVTEQLADSAYATKSLFGTLTQSNSGLVEGLLRMHEGEQAALLLPSTLAFGDQSAYNGLIPANSPVRFDVRLKRARTEDQQINEYMTANQLTPTEVTTSGLRFIKTLNNSSGAMPTATQSLLVKYKGKLLRSASAFDSTGTGTYPFTRGNSIAGFDEGLSKLKVGEKATIIFPSKIGYGNNGYQSIPPYAPLRFDIELVSVQ